MQCPGLPLFYGKNHNINMIDIQGDVDKWECVYKECGAKCCKPPKATLGDLRRISDATGKKPAEFSNLCDSQGLFELKAKGGNCFSLSDDYTCQLYKTDRKALPLSCRMFPFLYGGIQYSDDIILTVKLADDCPGVGKGDLLGDELKETIERYGSQLLRETEQYLRQKKAGLSFDEIFEKGR